MKVDAKTFYTDYPLVEGVPERVLWTPSDNQPSRAVVDVKYDGNKYITCKDVQSGLYDSFKIGYLFVDPQLTRRPNAKMKAAMEGKNRAPKARYRKTEYEVFLPNDACGFPVVRKFDTLAKAIRCASTVMGGVEVKISQYKQMEGNGGSVYSRGVLRVFVRDGVVIWKDTWARSHSRGRGWNVYKMKYGEE